MQNESVFVTKICVCLYFGTDSLMSLSWAFAGSKIRFIFNYVSILIIINVIIIGISSENRKQGLFAISGRSLI